MMQLSEAANLLNGKLCGQDARFTSVSSDSRNIRPGALFVAIEGERLDGHDYVASAMDLGAVGALVSKSMRSRTGLIHVEDTTISLGQLAAAWRRKFPIPIIGITGSNGKTTVTAMAASILGQKGKCLSPRKSFNNQWGVPLTLLGLRDDHTSAVIEMGTNQEGEIAYLTDIALPTISLINNVGQAHLEGLESEEKIAHAKSEIYAGLADNGTAVINLDDRFAAQWIRQVTNLPGDHKVATFGSAEADIVLKEVKSEDESSEIAIEFGSEVLHVHLPMPGMHNAMNAVAAAAVSRAAGADTDSIKRGLESVSPVEGRLNVKSAPGGVRVIDDSYNANPVSIKAGIDVLKNFSGKRILVLGRMAELGPESKNFHKEVGKYARDCGIDLLVSLDETPNSDCELYILGFGGNGHHFDSEKKLLDYLDSEIEDGSVLLVKGSRSSRMECVVEKLVNPISGVKEETPC